MTAELARPRPAYAYPRLTPPAHQTSKSPTCPYTAPTVTIFLVRHASALDRGGWTLDDFDRPLDGRGRRQSATITDYFADRPIRAVWSSQAVRCIDTVSATAAHHGLNVEIRAELIEGARPDDLLERIRKEAEIEDDLVMCTHGDLIPEVLNRLLRRGMVLHGACGCTKGSIWALHTTGLTISNGTYIAAP